MADRQPEQRHAGDAGRVQLVAEIDVVGVESHQPRIHGAQRGHHARQLGIAEEGRRAAAEVQLRDRLAGAEVRDVQGDLLVERIEVLGGALVVLGDHLVARAVVAQRLAERDVHVDRQRARAADHAAARGALLEWVAWPDATPALFRRPADLSAPAEELPGLDAQLLFGPTASDAITLLGAQQSGGPVVIRAFAR